MRIVFLVSGNGGNLKFINSIKKEFAFEIVCVIADRNCRALEYANRNGINCKVLNFNRSKESNLLLIDELNKLKSDVIITNVHKIIHEDVLENVGAEFINLHYSILPAFGGLIGYKPVEMAINRNNKFHGVTVHKVSKEVDEGDTLAQSVYPLNQSSNIVQLNFMAGCLALLNALIYWKSSVDKSGVYKNILISPFSEDLGQEELTKVFNRLKND